MKCKDIQEMVGEVLDRHLSGGRKDEFFSHLGDCSHCRNQYEIELLAKNIVHDKIPRVPTPRHVYESILAGLHKQQAGSGESWLSRFLTRRVFVPALSAGLAIVLFFLLLSIPLQPDEFDHSASNDIIRQSLDNFDLVRSGELKPSMIACYPDIVVGYFDKQNVEFKVNVLFDDSCDWYGATANTYDGVKLAHLVYKRGDDLMYVYEVKKDDAIGGSVLSLPQAAKESLASTGWYTDPEHEGCNVVLWTIDETLCAAVSTMNKDRMMALLTTQ